MKVYIYCKMTDKIEDFKNLTQNYSEVCISVENKNSFRELEKIKNELDSILFISSLSSIGLNDADIATQLSWFITNEKSLVILNIPSTYEYGIGQPLNKAILETILQSLIKNNKITPYHPKIGRNKIVFPDSWDELYEKWTNKEISSKEFIKESGLKKATFYNMLTEYRETRKENEKFVEKYKMA